MKKSRLLKSSTETAQRLAKEAIKSGRLIEEERMFPIYVVVSNPDKNNDIMIIHPAHPITPFQNSTNNFNKSSGDKSSLPIDKPIRPIGRINEKNNPEDKENNKL
jgi:hypothetical protein